MDDSNFVVMINNLYIRWYYDNNYENIKKKQRKKKHMINGNDKWYISTEYKKKMFNYDMLYSGFHKSQCDYICDCNNNIIRDSIFHSKIKYFILSTNR